MMAIEGVAVERSAGRCVARQFSQRQAMVIVVIIQILFQVDRVGAVNRLVGRRRSRTLS